MTSGKFIDRTGKRYGRLVVIKQLRSRGAYPRWLCQCDCGNRLGFYSKNLGRSTLSCGCLALEFITRRPSAELPPIPVGKPMTLRIIDALADGPLERSAIAYRLPDAPHRDVYSRVSAMTHRGILLKQGRLFSVFRSPRRPGRPTNEEASNPMHGARPRGKFDLQDVWR